MQNLVSLIIENLAFLIFLCVFLFLPILVRSLGPLILWNDKLTTSRLFGIVLHLLVIIVTVPLTAFLLFLPTGAVLVFIMLSTGSEEVGVLSSTSIFLIFIIATIIVQFLIIRFTIREELAYTGLTLSQYVRRFFDTSYKEERQKQREITAQRVEKFYSTLDTVKTKVRPTPSQSRFPSPELVKVNARTQISGRPVFDHKSFLIHDLNQHRDQTEGLKQSLRTWLVNRGIFLRAVFSVLAASGATAGIFIISSAFTGMVNITHQQQQVLLDFGNVIVFIAAANLCVGFLLLSTLRPDLAKNKGYNFASILTLILLFTGALLLGISIWILFTYFPG
ncbi:MAG: hypothetical protein ACFFBD_08950 [Candidatus Hodarchaeota archaeon]